MSRTLRERITDWMPTVLWAILLFIFSGGQYGGEGSWHILAPILRWLLPEASLAELLAWHSLVRKAAHVAGYLVLGLTVLHGVRRGRAGWNPRWALAAWVLASGYAVTDELHQRFVPGRSGSLRDVALDSAAAAASQALAWVWWRVGLALRRARPLTGSMGGDGDEHRAT